MKTIIPTTSPAKLKEAVNHLGQTVQALRDALPDANEVLALSILQLLRSAVELKNSAAHLNSAAEREAGTGGDQ